MEIGKQTVGIWGFGIVGRSTARFLKQRGATIDIIDKRLLVPEEMACARELGTWQQAESIDEIEKFLARNDTIIVSPGIDTRPFSHYAYKFVAELDLFHAFYKKPIVAITGSVGKTTITTLLSHILTSMDFGWWTGGNIGTCMMDALAIQDQTKGVILELSSFQLEHCKTFSPDMAIITNIVPNHLDRHGTLEDYIKAKFNIITHQHNGQQALLPLEYKEIISTRTAGTCHYFSDHKPTEADIATLPATSNLFFYQDRCMHRYYNGICRPVINLDHLPPITFTINWLIACAALQLRGIKLDTLDSIVRSCKLPAHRLELVCTLNGIDFYNDSKGTTVAATLAAVTQLKEKPIILLLGGMGKGVDRGNLIRDVKPYVKTIICFGKEHQELALKCQLHGLDQIATAHLETAIQIAINKASSGDQIVLSPAGTSYDEFKNYEERGNFFKEYVKNIQNIYQQR